MKIKYFNGLFKKNILSKYKKEKNIRKKKEKNIKDYKIKNNKKIIKRYIKILC